MRQHSQVVGSVISSPTSRRFSRAVRHDRPDRHPSAVRVITRRAQEQQEATGNPVPEGWRGAWSDSDFKLVAAVRDRFPDRFPEDSSGWPVYIAGVLDVSAACIELAKVFEGTGMGSELAEALRAAQKVALAEVVRTVSAGTCEFAVALALVAGAK